MGHSVLVVDDQPIIRDMLQKALVKENQRLLELVKKQAGSIDEMEKKYPGISTVKKDANGAIIIDDNDSKP